MDDLEELRHLMLRHERTEITRLRTELEERGKKLTEDVARVLPEALERSRELGPELAKALSPTLQKSIQESIENNRQSFIDSFHPIMFSLIARAVSEGLRTQVEKLNKTLENALSLQGLKWRLEALRTNTPFAEIVLLNSLRYRTEQLFLIHRETSLVLLHVKNEGTVAKDSDMVAAMMRAIGDFAHDSFDVKKDAILEDFHIGNLQGWVTVGPYAYLAAAFDGTPPRRLYGALEKTLMKIHRRHGAELANFQGDPAVFEPSLPLLKAYLNEPDAKPNLARAWLALAGAAALFVCGSVLLFQSWQRWEGFLQQLAHERGLAVTSAHKRWFSHSRLAGLRDPLAADPAAIARAAHLDPTKIDFNWKEYLALDPESILLRFRQRFPIPEGAQATFQEGTISLSGAVPAEWLATVLRDGASVAGVKKVQEKYDPARVLERFTHAFPLPEGLTARVEKETVVLSGHATYDWITDVEARATSLPSITKLSEKELQIVYEAPRVLARFRERFSPPEDITSAFHEGTLTLAGEASHAWLTRVRAGATEVSGITAVDDKMVTDLDEQAFQQAKSVIESAFVYFLPNKDDFATEGFAALSRLPDEIRRCESAARHIGRELTVEIRGQADATGLSDKNSELSRRRAETVSTFLVQCGLPATMMKPLAMGAPSAAPETADAKPAGEQSQRRVAFRVLSQAVSARP